MKEEWAFVFQVAAPAATLHFLLDGPFPALQHLARKFGYVRDRNVQCRCVILPLPSKSVTISVRDIAGRILRQRNIVQNETELVDAAFALAPRNIPLEDVYCYADPWPEIEVKSLIVNFESGGLKCSVEHLHYTACLRL